MPTDKKKIKNIELNVDPSLKTLWVDHIVLANRLDGISCVRLSTNLPEGVFEQMRFMTSESHLKSFINTLCLNLDYFPTKESIEEENKKK